MILKMNKKKINFLSIFFLLSFFLPTTLFSVESFEDDARNKRLGLEGRDLDSDHVHREKFLRDIELNNIENIKLFIERNGGEINFIVNNINPFTHAATTSNFGLVKFLLNETEINIDATDGLGNTALIIACEKGLLEIVNYLIDNGANVNHQNKQGLTPAMKAAENNNFFIVKLLLDKNIDLTISDFTGRTLKEISENSRDKRILKLLKEKS